MRLNSKAVTAFVAALFATCVVGASSFDGEWNGNLRCDASLVNPKKFPAFSNPITMVVVGRTAKIARNTDEVTESLTGEVTGSGHSSFSGSGKSKANDRGWTTKIDGQFSGNLFSGNGQIYRENGVKGRECFVELARADTQIPKTSQDPEGAPARPTLAAETQTVTTAIPGASVPMSERASASKTSAMGQEVTKLQTENEKSNNFQIFLIVIAAAIGGWIWNKFIRARCPNCKSTSFDTVNVTETDRFKGTKKVTEKTSRGTNTRHVQTTYVMRLYDYRCKSCQHQWTKEKKEEL